MKTILFALAVACCTAITANAQEVGVAGVPYLTLNNGAKMPLFGLGTYQVPTNEICKDAVLTALRAGYRHIDTAHAYLDERGVGEAINEFIAEGGCQREDIWVTSKLWPSEYADPAAIDRMLRRLNLDYVDLVYPHQPVGEVKTVWRHLEKAVKEGRVRTLGLSNFDMEGAEAIYRWTVDSTEVKPAIIQIECHPYAQRVEVRKKAARDGLAVECWYPLGGTMSQGELLRDAVIVDIANAHHVTPAQVLIRWEVQEGMSAIPGATNPEYIKENIASMNFTLTKSDMKRIQKLNKEMRYFTTSWEESQGYTQWNVMDLQEREEEELVKLSGRMWNWVVEKNADALSGVFHKDAMFVHRGGTWGRKMELEAIRNGTFTLHKAEVMRAEARISGETAVVYADIRLSADENGQKVDAPYFVSETYTREGNVWKLLTMSFTAQVAQN